MVRGSLVFAMGVLHVFDGHEIAEVKSMVAEDAASERIGKMLELIIDELAGLHDRIVKIRDGRGGKDDRHDAFDVLLGVVTKAVDLVGSIAFRKFEIMELGVTNLGIREDVDFGEAGTDIFERAEGNNTVVGNRIVVGVDFE